MTGTKPSTNGRGPKPAAPHREAFFGDMTVDRLSQIEDGMRRMKKCPGFRQLRGVVDRAYQLRAEIVDLLTHYGEGTGSATEKFLSDYREFDDSRSEIWDVLMSLAVDLGMKADDVSGKVPGI